MGEAKRRRRCDPQYGKIRRLDPKKFLVPFMETKACVYDKNAGLDFLLGHKGNSAVPESERLTCRGTVDPQSIAAAAASGLFEGQIFAVLTFNMGRADSVPGCVLEAGDQDFARLPDGLSITWVTDGEIALTFVNFMSANPSLRSAIHTSVLERSSDAVAHSMAFQRRNGLVSI